MPTFLIVNVLYVEAEDGQAALDRVAQTCKPLKADERHAYAIAAPEGDEWSEDIYATIAEDQATSRTIS